jgi:putative transposase
VKFAVSRKLSVRRACELVEVSRRRLRYASRRRDDTVAERLKELARRHVRFGYRRLHAMLRRELERDGLHINVKRVRRLCVKLGLKLSRKRRRKRRGIGCGVPCRAEHPNHVWAYDFLEDRTETGRKLRVLTIEDEFTRLCLEIEVEHRMNARFVAQTLLRLFAEHGVPRFIRSDNGPEFIARALMRMLAIHGVEARHIEPGSPWQNGINERFNGSYRDECANLETFHNRDHARALSKLYKQHYNEVRPHSSLGYQTPAEFAALSKQKQIQKDGCAGGGKLRFSHCASSGRADKGKGKRSGPTAMNDRPDDRRMIHVGAPVARQQSRILRVDDMKLSNRKRAGKVPVHKR